MGNGKNERRNTMSLTAEQVKQAWERNPRQLAHAFGATLRDFGYADLSDEYAETEIKRLLEGGEPIGGPSLFLSGWLTEGVD